MAIGLDCSQEHTEIFYIMFGFGTSSTNEKQIEEFVNNNFNSAIVFGSHPSAWVGADITDFLCHCVSAGTEPALVSGFWGALKLG